MRKFIINEAFGIIALVVLLIPQVAHTVFVFEVNSHYDNPWFGWCYAIGIDLAILIFTVKGWIRTAILYLAGTLAHNLVYQFFPDSMVSAVLICVMLSGTLFSFSHLFYYRGGATDRNGAAPHPPHSAPALALGAAMKAGVRFTAQPYHCPQCGEAFTTPKQLNGHISGHKQKSEWEATRYGAWEEENRKRAELVSRVELTATSGETSPPKTT